MVQLILNAKGKPADIGTSLHVYTLVLNRAVQYVSFGTLAEILSFKDVMKNPAFDKELEWMIVVKSSHAKEIDAYNAVAQFINDHLDGRTPPLNLTMSYNTRGNVIVCRETGARYRNAAEACRIHNIQPGWMSKHLARKPGHKTNRGLSFEYAAYMGLDGQIIDNSQPRPRSVPLRPGEFPVINQ